jgi:poly(3-hydroxybutyrate) depolymerase
MKLLLAFFIAAAVSVGSGTELVLKEGLGLTQPGNSRSPIRRDAVEFSLLNGNGLDQFSWSPVKANADGAFEGPVTQSGYIRFDVPSDQEKVMFLEAVGNAMVYVNGKPHAGDIYMYGYHSVPVLLKPGKNQLLFALGRGRFQAKLIDVPKPISLDLRDSTTPDVLIGGEKSGLAAVVVRNATTQSLDDLEIRSGKFKTKVGRILPMTSRKAGFQIPFSTDGKVTISLFQRGKKLDEAMLNLRVRKPSESHKITFRSKIDGSVQYFAVQPSTKPGENQALVLSLHGASVEAIGQADAYSAKSWGTIVCPTNRRPYGFNWEDQGRLDALEVLEIAKKRFSPDPSRIYLTGHSMGGHGTWQLGAHYSDQFAAIAPAAGWESYWSYAGGASFPNPSPIETTLLRGMSPSRTLGLKENFKNLGVFILHGDSDETVPIREANTMADALASISHPNWKIKRVPGAGHWWDNDPEPGADAVDDADLFSFMIRNRIPASQEVKEINFTTADPGVSDRHFWVTIDRQEVVRNLSIVKVKAQPFLRKISGTTSNIRNLSFRTDALHPGGPVTIELDGQTLTAPFSREIHLQKGVQWKVINQHPRRFQHGFKSMFNRNIALVIDDQSSVSGWQFEFVRYLQEQWRIIANGEFDVLYRSEVTPAIAKERNLIFVTDDQSLLPADHPRIPSVLTHMHGGEQIGVIFGGKAVTRLPYFTAGAHMPDVFAFRPEMLRDGSGAVQIAKFWGD